MIGRQRAHSVAPIVSTHANFLGKLKMDSCYQQCKLNFTIIQHIIYTVLSEIKLQKNVNYYYGAASYDISRLATGHFFACALIIFAFLFSKIQALIIIHFFLFTCLKFLRPMETKILPYVCRHKCLPT